MSSPFSSSVQTGQPLWTATAVLTGNFSVFPSVSSGSGEVGYGQGGYGQDGYDAPSVTVPSTSTPNWTVETVR